MIAHLCHLLSTLILYQLSLIIFQSNPVSKAPRIAFVSACLHVITPAGIFLSAPCAESLFSFLHFSGLYFYTKSRTSVDSRRRDLNLLISGLFIGLATTVRSNGVLSGLIFALDAFHDAFTLLRVDRSYAIRRKITVTVLAGLLVASGTLLPQWLAYNEFCIDNWGSDRRIWCTGTFPSIYAWVQSHYW